MKPPEPAAPKSAGAAPAPTSAGAAKPERPALGTWLADRTGWPALWEKIANEPIVGGARFAYVFGSVVLLLLLVQFFSGVLLATVYTPSVQHAWASVAYLQDQLKWGALVRGLHHHGASTLMLAVVAHFLQVILYGAYRPPRELNFLSGLALFGLLAAFALTGYLLPWDQKGYWATQVVTGLMEAVPGIGGFLRRFVVGGAAYGQLTLSRFFVIHVFVLPAIVLGLIALHLWLFRRHGVTPKPKLTGQTAARVDSFVPAQLGRDVMACSIVLLALVGVAIFSPAPLAAPADPASTYIARPEWYFLPLFALLKIVEGRGQILVAMGSIALVGVLLGRLPFSKKASQRKLPAKSTLAGVGAGLAIVIALGAWAAWSDHRDPHLAAAQKRADDLSQESRKLAQGGLPVGSGAAGIYENDPDFAVRALFAEHCSGCHSLDGKGGERGPDFLGYNDRAWIEAFLRNPDGPLHMGPAKLKEGMKPVKAEPVAMSELVELVYGEQGAPDVDKAKSESGARRFADSHCGDCHEIDGTSEGEGPNLGGRGTLRYVSAIISNAGAAHLYGERNRMPKFEQKLSRDEIERLAAFVISQRNRRGPAPIPSGKAAEGDGGR